MKKILKVSDSQEDLRYANWIKAMIDLIKPKNLYLIGGRGVAKSTDILAERSIDVIYDMPRACFAFVGATYIDLMANIIPAVLLGWERKKFYENYHYVVDKEPPEHWKRPFIKTFSWKHTLSTFNGCKFFMTSLDRPSSNAGISVVHHFGDEAKYMEKEKLNKLFPTLRGDKILYGSSHYFMGQTFASDMPNPATEHTWMLDMEKNMDANQIRLILQAALIYNDILIERYNAEKDGASQNKLHKIDLKVRKWEERLGKIRQNSTFFYVVSAFANVDILTLEYFHNTLITLGWEEFKTAVLSMRNTLEKGQQFYGNLTDSHFYYDGYNYEYYDKFGLRDNITQCSLGLKHIRHDMILEAGFDAGNMMSLVIGQEQGHDYRVLKNIYTLVPEFIPELATKFRDFFKTHKTKVLHLYFDRSANNYQQAKQDFATKLKHAIEHNPDDKPSGWTVVLMSIGQKNITHSEEFNLMSELMGGNNKHMPRLLIDAHECKELKSSLELAPVEKDSKGMIKKVKKSEKLATHRLPMESTNMSDAFKYLFCRSKFLALARSRKSISFGDVSVH